MLEQKPSFVRRFRLAFKEKWRPAPHNDSIWVTRRSLIFPGRSHLTWLPGGIGDLRVSCNMQTDASAVVCAGRKEGKGWALVLCRWQYWCVGADGVLQLFLCQSIKALHHTVCRQTSLRVMIPALCYSRTQELHALKQQAQMSVTHSKKLVNIISVCQCQQIYTYAYLQCVYIIISGGPLSALTCCVNARLLSAIKKISPLIYSQSWVGSWVYTTQAMMTFTLIF